MQVILISRFFLSSKSVDSTSSIQLVKELKRINPRIKIHVVTSEDTYKNDPERSDTCLDHVDQIHVVKSLYSGTNSMLLLLATIIGGLRLVLKAKNLGISNIITLTNPPLISFWCSLFLRKKNWAYWSFDLYPDALSASGILSENNWIYRFIHFIVYKFPPSFLICLGEKQRDYLFKKYRSELPYTILPCGIFSSPQSNNLDLPLWYDKTKKYIGYLGNIGKAHSKEFLVGTINNIDHLHEFTLILAVYGEHKREIEELVHRKKSKKILIVGSVERHHLSLIDIHMVSLLPEWTHISVPSKAVSAVSSGSALCYYGSTQSDTWNMFEKCSFYVENVESIPGMFSAIDRSSLQQKKLEALKISKELLPLEKQAFNDVFHFLTPTYIV